MTKEELFDKVQLMVMIIFAIIALLILVDYRFTGSTVIEDVIDKTSRLENKHSVARNFYVVYYIHTQENTIAVSKDFQSIAHLNEGVNIEKSLLFNEINNVTILASKKSEIYSFRTASGLLLPSLVLIILGLGYTLRSRINTLVFVSEVVLLIDFIFLLL